MANFSFDGVDAFQVTFSQLQQLTSDELLGVIRPAAEELQQALSSAATSSFTSRTGSLSGSIQLEERTDGDGASIVVLPKGQHPKSSTGKRRGKRRSNGRYSGTNAEVAAILNYGSSRIPATLWHDTAVEEAETQINASMQAEWNRLLDAKGI